MLKLVGLLAIAVSGWALGRARPAINLQVLVLTFFAAVTAHSWMGTVFLDGRMDLVLGDPRTDALPIVIVPIAGGEAVGLWLPFLVLPWARIGARIAAAVYAFASATVAAVYFYFPFDLGIVDVRSIQLEGPPYLLAWFVCLPIAAVGYLAGWAKSSRERAEL